jgi:hypothetical protein
MELISMVLGLIGVIISGTAYYKADTAKKAVDRMISRRNTYEDLDRLKSLIRCLKAAQEAVGPWRSGISSNRRMGRNQEDDLSQLGETVDHLRTKSPLELDAKLGRIIKKSASVLEKEFNEIARLTDNQDHWKAAHSEIQVMIRKLEQVERKMWDGQLAN